MTDVRKSITIHGLFSEAYIFRCDIYFAKNGELNVLNVTLSKLVFHISRVTFSNRGPINAAITKCRFMNCPVGVSIQEGESYSRGCQKSTLAVTDSEFWYNVQSIFVK